MLSGLSFLHKCGIIHTDIKPENILLKSPLFDPPAPTKTMFDLVQEQINGNPEIQSLKQQCDDVNLSAAERKTLKAKMKKVRMKIKKGLSSTGIPTLWGFFRFNFSEAANDTAERIEELTNTELTKAEWIYPEDCFYIKMYILCPLDAMEKAFGPRHGYGDEKSRFVMSFTHSTHIYSYFIHFPSFIQSHTLHIFSPP